MPNVTKNRKVLVSKSSKPQTYASLRSEVRKAIALGKERATRAVEREKVQTCWEVGTLIVKHVLLHQERADYGQAVILKLARDLGVSRTELNRMVEFAEAYPISAPARQLSWSHFRDLLSVNDTTKRNKLIVSASNESWSRQKLRSEIKKVKRSDPKKSQSHLKNEKLLIEPALGKVGVYRQIKWRGRTVYDLGFTTYFEVKGKARKSKVPKATELYFYEGVVDRVVDGDTVWVDVHLGFGIWSYQKLRLRGLNAPEIGLKAGQNAKAYLFRKLKKGTDVILKTTQSDKFDRYLADLWLNEKHINSMLIRAKHARAI